MMHAEGSGPRLHGRPEKACTWAEKKNKTAHSHVINVSAAPLNLSRDHLLANTANSSLFSLQRAPKSAYLSMAHVHTFVAVHVAIVASANFHPHIAYGDHHVMSD